MKGKKGIRWVVGLSVLLVTVGVTCLFIGQESLDLGRALDSSIAPSENSDASILFRLRLPRILLAVLVGGGLSVAGCSFQALLRNSLATPFTLGVSGGASLGAVLAIYLGLEFTLLGLSTVPIFGIFGSIFSVLLIYMLARTGGRLPTVTLLLAGVTYNFFCSAVILFIHYLADPGQAHRMIYWLMGSLDVVGMSSVVNLLPIVLVTTVVLCLLARSFNVLTLGDDTALGLGVNVDRTRKISFVLASALTGSVIAASGPIVFIGLIVPHAMRLLLGPDHRTLLPASFLMGGVFLILCDTLARTMIPQGELPVGVLTGMCGGPFFIWLLRSRKREIVL